MQLNMAWPRREEKQETEQFCFYRQKHCLFLSRMRKRPSQKNELIFLVRVKNSNMARRLDKYISKKKQHDMEGVERREILLGKK